MKKKLFIKFFSDLFGFRRNPIALNINFSLSVLFCKVQYFNFFSSNKISYITINIPIYISFVSNYAKLKKDNLNIFLINSVWSLLTVTICYIGLNIVRKYKDGWM